MPRIRFATSADYTPPPAPRTGVWMGALAACCAGVLVVYLFFVLSEPGQLIDVGMRRGTETMAHPLLELNPENRWIAAWILVPPAVVVATLTLPAQRYWAALMALATVAGANITTQVLKHGLLDRPELVEGAGTSNALPSGHTTMAASAAVAVLLVSPARWRPVWGVLAGLWAAGWGVGIFVENWHWASDMISAYLVSAAWGVAAGWVLFRTETQWNMITDQHRESGARAEWLMFTTGAVTVACAVLCLFLGGGWAGLERSLMGEFSRWHWLAGVGFCGGAAVLIAAAGMRLFRREAAPVTSPVPLAH